LEIVQALSNKRSPFLRELVLRSRAEKFLKNDVAFIVILEISEKPEKERFGTRFWNKSPSKATLSYLSHFLVFNILKSLV
jgi:hypothetical protein